MVFPVSKQVNPSHRKCPEYRPASTNRRGTNKREVATQNITLRSSVGSEAMNSWINIPEYSSSEISNYKPHGTHLTLDLMEVQ